MSTTDPSVPANVVIHPLTSLALQPSTITPAQVTMASLSEQDATGMCYSLRWRRKKETLPDISLITDLWILQVLRTSAMSWAALGW